MIFQKTFQGVPASVFGYFAVLNRLFGAAVQTGKAEDTLISPYGFSVRVITYIIRGAEFFAYSAGGAAFGMKILA